MVVGQAREHVDNQGDVGDIRHDEAGLGSEMTNQVLDQNQSNYFSTSFKCKIVTMSLKRMFTIQQQVGN